MKRSRRNSLNKTMKAYYKEDALLQASLGGRVIKTPVPRGVRQWLHDHDQHRLCDIRMLVFSMPSPENVGWRSVHRPGSKSRRRPFLSTKSFLHFHASYVGGVLEHLLWRWKPWKDWSGKKVWANLKDQGLFERDLSEGIADADSGRTYKWDRDDRHAPSVPSESWQFDDPKQPEGWHEENGKWTINTVGWWPDPHGHWRYTKPGDPGWRMKDDESWEYVRADGSIR